jgi:hypothetical protein
MSLFVITERLSDALAMGDSIPPQRLHGLLKRIVQKLTTKEKNFSATEEEQLQDLFDMALQDLRSFLNASAYIFQQATFYGCSPSKLKVQLGETNLSPEQVEVFVTTWETYGPAVLKQMRDCPFGPKSLQQVDWEYRHTLASGTSSHGGDAKCLLEFSLQDVDSGNNSFFNAEFTRDELYDFFVKLETIQNQLDMMSS